MRGTMELLLNNVKLADNASAPAKELLAAMRAMLDEEDAHAPRKPNMQKLNFERVDAPLARPNRPSNDSERRRQPQHQHQTSVASSHASAVPSSRIAPMKGAPSRPKTMGTSVQRNHKRGKSRHRRKSLPSEDKQWAGRDIPLPRSSSSSPRRSSLESAVQVCMLLLDIY